MSDKEQLYYVECARYVVGNCMLFWRPYSNGYTTELDKAGLYTADEVRGMRKFDIGWPKEVIEGAVAKHVRRDVLRGEDVKTINGKWS